MKSFSKLMLMLVLLVSGESFAQNFGQDKIPFATRAAGHRGGNGGNSIAADFVTIAQNIMIVWKDICSKQGNSYKTSSNDCRYIQDFSQLLSNTSALYTTILVQERTQAFDGAERDAINDGTNTITVNKTRWDAMVETNNRKSHVNLLKLVLHEYFTILGLDSSDYYQASNNLIGKILRKGYLPEVLTRSEGLSDTCSINVLKNGNKVNQSDIASLGTKGYIIHSDDERSRYSLKIKRVCYDKSIGNLCSIYLEKLDNFTGKVAEDFLYAKKFTTSAAKARKKILSLALDEIKSCR